MNNFKELDLYFTLYYTNKFEKCILNKINL